MYIYILYIYIKHIIYLPQRNIPSHQTQILPQLLEPWLGQLPQSWQECGLKMIYLFFRSIIWCNNIWLIRSNNNFDFWGSSYPNIVHQFIGCKASLWISPSFLQDNWTIESWRKQIAFRYRWRDQSGEWWAQRFLCKCQWTPVMAGITPIQRSGVIDVSYGFPEIRGGWFCRAVPPKLHREPGHGPRSKKSRQRGAAEPREILQWYASRGDLNSDAALLLEDVRSPWEGLLKNG